jgi:dihydroorotase (multifunctional complex type)
MEDLVIKNGILVTPQGEVRGGLTVSGGKISYVGEDGSLPKANREINAQGFMVLPGLIDPHVHLGGNSEERFKNQCRSESVSAALGGVTTLITTARFGNALDPRLIYYRKAKDIACSHSFIDFKFNAFIFNQEHLDEIPKLMEEGIHSFKLMMHLTPEIAREQELAAIDWSFAYKLLEIVSKLGPPAFAMMHCEDPTIPTMLGHRLMTEGRQDIVAWTESRPSFTETMQVYGACLMAKEIGATLYIVHISAKESVDALRYFKERGLMAYGETCPHYLVLDRNPNCGLLAKVVPPLRDEPDQARLWAGLRDGTLDTVGSDHCPSFLRQDRMTGGLWKGGFGFGGIGAILPLLVSEGVNKGRLTWEELVKITSENSAKIFHIYPQKGAISPGSDADLIVVNPKKEWVLDAQTLQSASDFSVYEGEKVKGCVLKTFLKGQLIAEDSRMVAQKPCGEYVLPSW